MIMVAVLVPSNIVYAFPATGSEATRSEIDNGFDFDEWQDLANDDEDFTIPTGVIIDDGDYTLDYIFDYFKSKILSEVSGSSDAVSDEDVLYSNDDVDINGTDSGVVNILSAPLFLASVDSDAFTNCVRFDAYIDGSSCILLFPAGDESSFYIDANNQLWNMTDSPVQGVVLYDGFNPLSYEGYLIYLNPCLGNNFSSNYNYGSPNYIRHYYLSSGRITYDTSYVTVNVDSAPWIFRVSDMSMYIMILLGGAILICLLKKSLR